MIPVAHPLISRNAKKYILEALSSGWISSKGPFVERFEKEFADFMGASYAVATNSGTSSIHLALAALDIGPGDEVIIPTLTMIAAALPIIYVGAKPVLVDSDAQTANLDVNLIESKITKKTKAIMVVHLNGHPADMAPILKLVKRYHLKLIEDAAESQGAQYITLDGKYKKVGSIGDIGCFSFYANKIITTGEGGMAITNDKKVAERMKAIRNLDRSKNVHFYHKSVAFAYRMSNLQAALGIAQLEEFERFTNIKKKLALIYMKELSNLDQINLPIEKPYAKRMYWNFDIILNGKRKTRDQIAKFLEEKGIETRNYVIPLHLQPAFLKKGFFKKESYPISEKISAYGLTLPLGLTLKPKEVTYICQNLKNALLSI